MKSSVALVIYEGPNLSTVFLISPGAPVIPYQLVWLPNSCVLFPPTETLYARLRPMGSRINAKSRARHSRWALDVRMEFLGRVSKFCNLGLLHHAAIMIINLGASILAHLPIMLNMRPSTWSWRWSRRVQATSKLGVIEMTAMAREIQDTRTIKRYKMLKCFFLIAFPSEWLTRSSSPSAAWCWFGGLSVVVAVVAREVFSNDGTNVRSGTSVIILRRMREGEEWRQTHLLKNEPWHTKENVRYAIPTKWS